MPLRQIGTRGRSVSRLAAVARHLHAAESPAYVNFEVAVLNELVAQLVEQRPFKAWVLGSSPSELTTHFGRCSFQMLLRRQAERLALASALIGPGPVAPA